jgi:hypothetical protein
MALDCNYDRLADMANYHSLLRHIMGLPAAGAEYSQFDYRTLSENVFHVNDELLEKTRNVYGMGDVHFS